MAETRNCPRTWQAWWLIYTSAFIALFLVPFLHGAEALSGNKPTLTGKYVFNEHHDPDGIGKFYMGREIAQVMGHQGADWLERPEREEEENSSALIQALKIEPGEVVADIGAGTGYVSRRLCKAVGEKGKVLAVDIQAEMLDLLTNKLAGTGVTNIIPVLGTTVDPRLPNGAVDLVLMVDVYHEFDFPYEMMTNICRALKPGGRVVFVEYRGEDPNVPIKPVHKMTEAQVRKEMSAQPLQWTKTNEVLPRQHVIEFRKKDLTSRDRRSEELKPAQIDVTRGELPRIIALR